MPADRRTESVKRHWERDGLATAILELLDASAADLGTLTVEDLAPLDQFHGGGLGFTRRLANLAGLTPGMRVLDVGGGLGGPARTLAIEFGCVVTVVDLADSYVEAGRMLTSLMGLGDRVTFQVGDALDLPFRAASFDAIWTQNSGMNIAAKDRLYAGFHHLIAPGGRLAIQEPMAGPVGPRIYPLMWASDPATDHLLAPDAMRALIERVGFRTIAWGEVTPDRSGTAAPHPSRTVQGLVMGEERVEAIMRASRRNDEEGRIVMVHAVFDA